MQLGRSRPLRRHSNPARVPASKNALTASGARLTRESGDSVQRLHQPWQTRAFIYYDMLGEIKYAAQFYSRALGTLELFAAEKNEKGEFEQTDNVKAIAALERIQDPGGGRSGLLSTYGRLIFLTGEALLFVTTDEDSGEEQWEMLSADELRIQGTTYLRYKAPSLSAEEFRAPKDDDYEPIEKGVAVAYRLWKRHPRFSQLADSTMQGILDLCEELVIMTQVVRARGKSRLAGNGVLWFDDKISPAPPEPVGDEAPLEDKFVSDLVEAMTAPITDEGAASAVVPLVVRVPVADGRSVGDMVYHMQLTDPQQVYPETGLRYEIVKRMAIGLDMPPEILMGLQDSNHWTAWQIDEQTWKGHLQPVAQQLVDDLTASYFRPELKKQNVPDYQKYYIAYDATSIINHPDRTRDAKDLYDKRAIGKRALRDASGFDDEDSPTKEELAEIIGVQTRDASLAWFGVPSIRGGTVETAPGELTKADPGAAGGGTGGPETGADVETGPPNQGDTPPVVGSGNGHKSASMEEASAYVLGAAGLALLRAREAAGNRLLWRAKRDADLNRLLNGVKTGDVCATLGRERVKELGGLSERELVATSRELMADAFRIWGFDEALSTLIVENVEQHAARTLYDLKPAPLPPSFTNHVSGLMAKSKVR